jgi:integrase
MEQKFEKIAEVNGEPTPWLYRRSYETKNRHVVLFYAVFTDWKGIRRRFPLGANLKQAKRKLDNYETKNNAEYDFDEAKQRNVTFTAWAEQCQSAFKPRDHSLLPHLERVFGSMALWKITDKEILDYRKIREGQGVIRRDKERARKISQTTINKELGFLRKLLRLAHNKGLIQRLPKFAMEHEPSRERVLSEEEFNGLMENSPKWLQRVMVCATETALSRGDLLGLTWEEIDRKKWIIQLKDGRNKTKVRQEIPIRTPALTALFKELDGEHKKLPNVERLVFTNDGQKIKPMKLRRALQRACKAAKVADFTFHDFRHCAITKWHVMAVPVSAAMRMAGHSSVQSHKKYVNMDTDKLIEVLTDCLQRNSAPTKNPASA